MAPGFTFFLPFFSFFPGGADCCDVASATLHNMSPCRLFDRGNKSHVLKISTQRCQEVRTMSDTRAMRHGEKMRIVVRKFRRETGITTEQQQDH